MRNFNKARYLLHKKARRRSRTYPLGTIAYYGPDDQRATKVVVGIVDKQNNLLAMEKWFSEQEDVRESATINQQIVDFLDRQHAESVAMPERIIGCPHEEGIDYPSGGSCPHCPFWKGKDRWTGALGN
jgi:hypothetical protein